MKEVSKFEEADEVFEIINPYEERGKQKGIAIGVKQGREEGIEQRNIEIALEMLSEDLPIELIAKITKLSIERIKQLKQKTKRI